MNPRRWVFRALSLVFSVSVSLVLVELGWRLLKLKRFTIEAGLEDPHFHHRLKPNQTYHYSSDEFSVDIRTNRYGLRAADPVLPKPAGVFRILMLGDSFTFGFPVRDEETFCHLIERGLREEGYPVEVVNGGVSGYSPTLHYLSLRDQYLAFEPDLVVLWYDLGDIQEDAWYQKNLLYDGEGRIVRCDPRYINGRFARWEWIRNHSLIAKYIDTKVLRLIHHVRVLGLAGFIKAKLRGERAKVAVARLKRQQRSDDLASSDRFLLVRESSTEEMLRPYWALSATYLRMIRDLLAERRIPFLLGVYPYGIVAGPDQWVKGRVFWGFEPGKTYSAEAALSLFWRFSSEEKIPLVNTFDSFIKEAAKGDKLFYDEDGHMTSAGQRVLANHVLRDPIFLSFLHRRFARKELQSVSAK